jgi:hypothetical protein
MHFHCKTSRLMYFKGDNSVYYKGHIKHICLDRLYVHNVQFFNVKGRGKYDCSTNSKG